MIRTLRQTIRDARVRATASERRHGNCSGWGPLPARDRLADPSPGDNHHDFRVHVFAVPLYRSSRSGLRLGDLSAVCLEGDAVRLGPAANAGIECVDDGDLV